MHSSDPHSKIENFASDQEVRWCPGCGDYAVLRAVQKVLLQLGLPPERHVFVSGIGCSSRLPYYLNTYGFHTIHGRAPTIATGLRLTRPDLSVWVVTGDGDGLSIGASHLLHLMRRNIDVTVLLLNNKIYGLTKGQYSPTSEKGQKSKTTPHGSLEEPLHPLSLALATGCTFIARAIDVDAPTLQWVLQEAASHRGTAFVEIYQNCNVFNDGVFSDISDRGYRSERTCVLRPGEPVVFGAQQEKRLSYQEGVFRVVDQNENVPFYVHRGEDEIGPLMQLAKMTYPDPLTCMGIFRKVARPPYEILLEERTQEFWTKRSKKDLEALLEEGGNTWVVPPAHR